MNHVIRHGEDGSRDREADPVDFLGLLSGHRARHHDDDENDGDEPIRPLCTSWQRLPRGVDCRGEETAPQPVTEGENPREAEEDW